MIVREKRALLHSLLSDFVRGEMPLRDLVRRLEEFPDTRDEAVDDLVFEFCLMHEDDDAREIRVGKAEWKLLQRTLLFLESDLPLGSPEAAGKRVRVWDWAHLAAVAALMGCGAALCMGAWYWHPLFALIALAACGCRWMQMRLHPEPPEPGIPFERVYPFASFSQLLAERKRNARFKKNPCPWAADSRWGGNAVPYSGFDGVVSVVNVMCFCVIIWPVVLLFLCLPNRVAREREEDSNAQE